MIAGDRDPAGQPQHEYGSCQPGKDDDGNGRECYVVPEVDAKPSNASMGFHPRVLFRPGPRQFVANLGRSSSRYSKAKIRFQSFFMLMMIQLFFFASSYSACVNVPTLVLGSPSAGP